MVQLARLGITLQSCQTFTNCSRHFPRRSTWTLRTKRTWCRWRGWASRCSPSRRRCSPTRPSATASPPATSAGAATCGRTRWVAASQNQQEGGYTLKDRWLHLKESSSVTALVRMPHAAASWPRAGCPVQASMLAGDSVVDDTLYSPHRPWCRTARAKEFVQGRMTKLPPKQCHAPHSDARHQTRRRKCSRTEHIHAAGPRPVRHSAIHLRRGLWLRAVCGICAGRPHVLRQQVRLAAFTGLRQSLMLQAVADSRGSCQASHAPERCTGPSGRGILP